MHPAAADRLRGRPRRTVRSARGARAAPRAPGPRTARRRRELRACTATARADDVVAEEHGEGLVADQRAGAEDGVAEAERLLLANVGDGRHLGDGLDLRKLFRLAPVVQVVLQLERRVEVILDGALASPGHDDDLGQARGDRLLDDVLDHRLVDEGSISFGCAFVAGRNRVPRPAAERRPCEPSRDHHTAQGRGRQRPTPSSTATMARTHAAWIEDEHRLARRRVLQRGEPRGRASRRGRGSAARSAAW